MIQVAHPFQSIIASDTSSPKFFHPAKLEGALTISSAACWNGSAAGGRERFGKSLQAELSFAGDGGLFDHAVGKKAMRSPGWSCTTVSS